MGRRLAPKPVTNVALDDMITLKGYKHPIVCVAENQSAYIHSWNQGDEEFPDNVSCIERSRSKMFDAGNGNQIIVSEHCIDDEEFPGTGVALGAFRCDAWNYIIKSLDERENSTFFLDHTTGTTSDFVISDRKYDSINEAIADKYRRADLSYKYNNLSSCICERVTKEDLQQAVGYVYTEEDIKAQVVGH